MISFFPRKKLKGFKGIQKQGIRFTGSSPDGKRMAVRARKGKQIGDQARHGIPFFFYDVKNIPCSSGGAFRQALLAERITDKGVLSSWDAAATNSIWLCRLFFRGLQKQACKR